jgi:diguanylate cyclase (GGDEF)-like protein
MELLLQTGLALSTTIDESTILAAIRDIILRLTEVGEFTICRWNPDEDQLVVLLDNAVESDGTLNSPGTTFDLSNFPRTRIALFERAAMQIKVDDHDADPLERQYLNSIGYSALLLLPMIVQDRSIGTVELFHQGDRTFNQEEIALWQVLANQIGSALENAYLYKEVQVHSLELEYLVKERTRELEHAYRRQQALAEIELAINQPHELQSVLDQIVRNTTELLPASSGATVILASQAEQIAYSATNLRKSETQTEDTVARVDHSTIRWILENRRAHVISDIYQSPAIENRGLERMNVRAFVGVPMMMDGDAIGVLFAFDHFQRPYSQDDLDFLHAMAQRASIAVSKVQLFDEIQRRAREAETLREASAVVAASLDQGSAIDKILDQLQHVVPSDMACVQLLEGEQIRTVGGRGWTNPEHIMSSFLEIPGNSPSSEVVLEGRPLIVDDPAKTYSEYNWEGYEKVRSWLGVPLKLNEFTIGLISLHSLQRNYFADSHARLAMAFASQVAVAMQNIRLFERTQEALEESRALYRVVGSLIESDNLQELGESLVHSVAHAINADRVILLLLDLQARQVLHQFSGGPGAELVTELSFTELWDGLAGWVLREGEPALSRKNRPEPREPQAIADARKKSKAGSTIVVPLTHESMILGTLTAINHIDDPDFRDSDLELLTAMATQAAQAIKNTRLLEETQHLAQTDALTGVANRREWFHRSQELFELAQANHKPMSVILMDIDHFKLINDAHGHLAGDLALQKLVEAWMGIMRENDVLARIGGDEFAILLPETGIQEAQVVAERIRQRTSLLAIQLEDNRRTIAASISAGIAEVEGHERLLDVFTSADRALYAAKRSGRNRIQAQG